MTDKTIDTLSQILLPEFDKKMDNNMINEKIDTISQELLHKFSNMEANYHAILVEIDDITNLNYYLSELNKLIKLNKFNSLNELNKNHIKERINEIIKTINTKSQKFEKHIPYLRCVLDDLIYFSYNLNKN